MNFTTTYNTTSVKYYKQYWYLRIKQFSVQTLVDCEQQC